MGRPCRGNKAKCPVAKPAAAIPIEPLSFADPFAAAFASAKAHNLQRLDTYYSMKGWDIAYPSEGDTLLQDVGGLRTTLDHYGLGFVVSDSSLIADNVFNTPLKTPQGYAPSASPGAVGAGRQVYAGERPTFVNAAAIGVVYDASRLGIPDGQIAAGAYRWNSTWQPFLPNVFQLSTLSYYQSAFDKKFEVEVGTFPNSPRFVGDQVGGRFASTFGPAASIHFLLGMSFIAEPAVNTQVNLTDRIYDKAGLQRSTPVHGATGNPIFDEAKENQAGVAFRLPHSGILVINEVGYRNAAAPSDPETWLRAGGLYNGSAFQDFSRVLSDPNATVRGNAALYVLGDRQVLQTAPNSPFTAYRGVYVGGTFEYAPARETAITQYYEGRIYSFGPFASRATDLVSFVYNHQVFSHYLADQLNPVSLATAQFGLPIPTAHHASNSYTLSYLLHLAPGLYLSTGLAYTDNPSETAFVGEGHALNVLGGLLGVF